jgi:hypothetical protein
MASVKSVRTKAGRIAVGLAATGAVAFFATGAAHAETPANEGSPYPLPECVSCVTVIPTTIVPATTTPAPTTEPAPLATSGATVLGETIVKPDAVAVAPDSSSTLPFTGVEVGGMVVLGGGLIAGGIALSMAGRRKAHEEG